MDFILVVIIPFTVVSGYTGTMAKILTYMRSYIFMGLILLAPFSLFPSIAIPTQNFESFRIGLYQVLAVAFIGLSVWPFIKDYIVTPFDRYARYIYTASVLLVGIAMYNLTTALQPGRSLLMSASFTFLVVLMLFARWWTSKYGIQSLIPKLLIAGCLCGGISLVQLAIATFDSDTTLLCSRCGEEVFGFPRINGFAAEPLFWANSLLPFWVFSVHRYVASKSTLSLFASILTTVSIVLTFSRGAYVALVVMAIAGLLLKLVSLKRAVRVGVVLVMSALIGFALLIASASIRYRETPNIAAETTKGMVEQLSGGVVTFKAEATKAPSKSDDNFQSTGFVAASTADRLSAAELALTAWRQPSNTLLGVGLGNLGPYVVANIDTSSPSNLTVYIFYILFVSEMGVLGLLLWLGMLCVTVYRLLKQRDETSKVLVVLLFGFLAHYAFFGSYINGMYIWLWFGVAMGYHLSVKKSVKSRKQTKMRVQSE